MGSMTSLSEDLTLTDYSATDRLTYHAAVHPDRLALAFIDDDLEVRQSWTFGELHRHARSVAGYLQNRDAVGARVVLAYPTCLEFMAAFYGCLYAGALAVPASLPLAHGKDRRLELIVADSGAKLVLTTDKNVEAIERRLAQGDAAAGVDVVSSDGLPDHSEIWRVVSSVPTDLAFLQYTSGSTRSPAGVMVSQGNLAANLRALHDGFGSSPESVYASWLPLFHDMGLIAGALAPTWAGCPVYLMSPASFIQNPMRWLRAFTLFGGTIGGGPNFAYQACVEAARAHGIDGLDLSKWQLAWNGAEPVRASTIADFNTSFAPAGFRAESMAPAFGLAEATLLVTGKRGPVVPAVCAVDDLALRSDSVVPCDDNAPQAKQLVCSGETALGVEVRIVDPVSLAASDTSSVGEIWVRGTSVGQGYWNKPDETAAVFQARTADGDGPFMRTGDLGFLRDGQLYVTGRRKDLIVIRGSQLLSPGYRADRRSEPRGPASRLLRHLRGRGRR